MLTITCYGAIREIGGNKIRLEDSGSAIMLDFGKSFASENAFFDEFLQPRTNSSLRDLLRLGILPPLPGIYRHDLLKHADAWSHLAKLNLPDSAFRLFATDIESYEESLLKGRPGLDGLLLSHGHADHCQHITYLDRRIPIYASNATYAILKAACDTGKSSFESDICNCSSSRIEPCGRTATFPGEISLKKDEKQARDIRTVQPYDDFKVGAFVVKALPVDHSVPGAYAYLITTPSGKTILYTGDIRFHGRFSLGEDSLTARLRERTRDLKPDIMITEGTRIDSDSADDESGVERRIAEAVAASSGLVIIDFGWKDTTRFETILSVARATGRTLAVNPKLAYLWNQLRLMEPDTWPDLSKDPNVKVYLKRTESLTYSLADYAKTKHALGTNLDWGERSKAMQAAFLSGDDDYLSERLCHHSNGVRAYQIAAEPSRFILHAGYFDMNELFDLEPPDGSIFIRAATEPFSDEMALDEQKLTRWLDFFGLNQGTGIRREHVSGHAGGPELLEFIEEVGPSVVIPIHTEHPEIFQRELVGVSEVISPELEVPMTF